MAGLESRGRDGAHLHGKRALDAGKAEIEASPDGISLGGAAIESLAVAGQISREQVATPGTGAYKSGVDRYRAMLASGMAYAWVVTPGNARLDQLVAGSSYVRMNLAARGLGLAVHPVSQALQEFPEMTAMLGQVNARLGITGRNRVQMLARLGHGPQVPRTPRWQLEQRLVTA